MNDYIELLQQAYKKLKSSVYFDKTQLILRDKIVRFETQNNLEVFFRKISDLMIGEKWDELFQPVYDSISFSMFPKEIEEYPNNGDKEDKPVFISNISSDKTKVNKVQTFIDMDVLGHLLGIVWILVAGYKLDQDIYEHSYGNRLRKKLIGDDGNPTFSPYLFEPYFQQYESWRDNALNIAQTALSKKQDVVILTLDFKRFFYSVDIDSETLKSIVLQKTDTETSYSKIVEPLTDFIYYVICTYSRKISDYIPDDVEDRRVLPIGFYPSNILANYCLMKFDQEVVDGWNPLYYGRYVDDIIIVDKVEKNGCLYKDAREGKLTADAIIDFYLTTCDLWRRKKTTHNNGLLIKDSDKNDSQIFTVNKEFSQFLGSNIHVQNSKVKSFYFEYDQTDALIDCFRNKISKNKSEFRFLPEDEPVFTKNDFSEIYSIIETDGPNKLRGVKNISVDKFELSKFLGKYQRISGLVHDYREKSFEKDVSKIFNNQVIIENYISWEKVISILAYNEKYDTLKDFIIKIIHSIEKIEMGEQVKKDCLNEIQVTLWSFLISSVNRTFSVLWGPKVNNLLSELETKLITSDYFVKCNSIFMRKEYCIARMCDKYAIVVPIDGFIVEDDMTIDDTTSTNLTCFSSIIFDKYKTDWIDNCSYVYYPYLFTIHDLTWTNSINNLINEKSTSDCDNISKLYSLYSKCNYLLDVSLQADESPIDFSDISSKVKANCKLTAIKIGNLKRDKIKIGVANAILFDSDFEKNIKQKPNRTYERYENLSKVVNEAIANNVNLLVMPECFIPFEWIPVLARTCAKNQIAVVTGVEHLRIHSKKAPSDLVYNLTAVILPYKQDDYNFSYIHFHTKKHLSPDERDTIESYRCLPMEGDSLELFCWNDFWFPVYCCYELASIIDRSLFQSYADALVAVEWNRDTKYYSNIVESLSRDLHCYCVQVNTAKYGDSRITQPTKSEEKDLLNVKGGINPTILVDTIDIGKLRNFQIRGNRLQRHSGTADYKPTPPDFNYDIVEKKINGLLWDYLKNDSEK